MSSAWVPAAESEGREEASQYDYPNHGRHPMETVKQRPSQWTEPGSHSQSPAGPARPHLASVAVEL